MNGITVAYKRRHVRAGSERGQSCEFCRHGSQTVRPSTATRLAFGAFAISEAGPALRRRRSPSAFSMQLLSSLNPAQREAVLHTEGPLLILAGAGSGKTRVITYPHRAPHQQRASRSPDEVLAVTFTNKAAEEMRQRVEQLLGDDCRQVWLSTFHSLCARLLRREAPAIGLTRDFVIYDSSDQLSVVKQAHEGARHRRQADPAARRARAHQPGEEPDGNARGACARPAGACATSRSPRSTRSTGGRSTTPARSISTTCC